MAIFNHKVFNRKVFNTDYEAEAVGDAWLGPPVPRSEFPIHLLVLVKDYLESKVAM